MTLGPPLGYGRLMGGLVTSRQGVNQPYGVFQAPLEYGFNVAGMVSGS